MFYYHSYISVCCYQVSYFSVRVMVILFNATFNNISALSWRSVLLVEETVLEYQEKTSDLPQVTDKFYD